MSIEFANLKMLYLVWVVPALGVWWYLAHRRTEDAVSAFVSPLMQAKLLPRASGARFLWQAALILAGLLLALVAAARPQWGLREERVFQRGRDLVIALDVSRSMLANDVRPNRLQRARADVLDLIKELRGDRAALLAFRRKAILLCPLTTDYAYLRQALDGAGIDSAPRGETDIGDAIAKALEAFESDQGAHKAIILISDGEDLSPPGRAAQAAEEAKRRGVPVFTVGLGSRGGSTIPEEAGGGLLKYGGSNVVTRLDNDTLYNIAKTTGGVYIPVETASMTRTTLGTLYRDHLRQIAAQDLEETLQRRRIDRFQWFLLPAVACLLAGTFLSRGRLRVRGQEAGSRGQGAEAEGVKNIEPPRRTLKNLAVLLLCVAATSGSAQTNAPTPVPPQSGAVTEAPPAPASTNVPATTPAADVPPGREGARIAQRLYLLHNYDEAAAAYQQAAKGATRDSQRDFRFNAAVALYQAQRYREAADLLKEIAPEFSADTRADAMAGVGASLFKAAEALSQTDVTNAVVRAQFIREAGEAFKDAWRARAQDETARRNLAVAMEALAGAEQQAKIARLTAQYQQTPPGQIADEMLQAQRTLDGETIAAYTNTQPSRIRQLEALADRQAANADLWIPLKGKLLAAMSQAAAATNAAQQMAQVEQMVEATRQNMFRTTDQLRDLDPAATESVAVSEAAIYQLWKAIAAYPELLREDIWQQTNALSAAAAATADARRLEESSARQAEALNLTRLFSTRFAAQVPEGGSAGGTNAVAQAPAPGTNAAPQQSISAEDRRKILELADQAVAEQQRAVASLAAKDAAAAMPAQEKSAELLKEIEKLLPKNRSRQEQKQEQRQEQQKQDQQQNQQEQKQQPSSDQQQQQSEEKKEPPPEEQRQPATPEDVKKMLEKALQREKEHADEVQERNRYVAPSTVDKDW